MVSLNLRAYPNPTRSQIHGLAALIARYRPHVALLQECRRDWLAVIEKVAHMTGVHSHWVPPETPERAFPPDGCAIAVRSPIQIDSSWRIDPALFRSEAVCEIPDELPVGSKPVPERLTYRYSARALLAELTVGGRRFAAGSFHATPGTAKVGGVRVSEWKSFFHAGVALQLAKLEARSSSLSTPTSHDRKRWSNAVSPGARATGTPDAIPLSLSLRGVDASIKSRAR